MRCRRLRLYPDDFDRPYFRLRANIIIDNYIVYGVWFIVDIGFRIKEPPETICEDRVRIRVSYRDCINFLRHETYVTVNAEELVKGLVEYNELREKGLDPSKPLGVNLSLLKMCLQHIYIGEIYLGSVSHVLLEGSMFKAEIELEHSLKVPCILIIWHGPSPISQNFLKALKAKLFIDYETLESYVEVCAY